MVGKAKKSGVIDKGFKLEELFDLIDSVKRKAAKGDKKSKAILESASKNWGSSSGYAY